MKTMLHPEGDIIVVALAEIPPFGPGGLSVHDLLDRLGSIYDDIEYSPFYCTRRPEGVKDGFEACIVTDGYMDELYHKGDLLFPPHDGCSVCTTSINQVLKTGKTPVVLLKVVPAGMMFGRHPSRVRLVPVESNCADAEHIFRMIRVQMNYTPPTPKEELEKAE